MHWIKENYPSGAFESRERFCHNINEKLKKIVSKNRYIPLIAFMGMYTENYFTLLLN